MNLFTHHIWKWGTHTNTIKRMSSKNICWNLFESRAVLQPNSFFILAAYFDEISRLHNFDRETYVLKQSRWATLWAQTMMLSYFIVINKRTKWAYQIKTRHSKYLHISNPIVSSGHCRCHSFDHKQAVGNGYCVKRS